MHGSDCKCRAYNALGQLTGQWDPAGNVFQYTYDAGGRQTVREVTTVASGFDGTVRSVHTGYDSRGMVSSVQQRDGSSAVLDEVHFVYDNWGNVASFIQDPDWAVGGGGRGSYSVDLSYEYLGRWHRVRPEV